MSKPAQPASTVCLSMIVKNETPVIRRCLESIKPILSYWVVVDTGSTDGTQDLVREIMKDIPGELHERPWRDFATNRNEALALADGKADYLLIIDADDLLEFDRGFKFPRLTADAIQVQVQYGSTGYVRTHMFRSGRAFHYVGVLHEVVLGPDDATSARLPGVTYRCIPDGARSGDPDKFKKDAAILEAALAAEPTNARYAFYLAQSYRDAGEPEKAIAAYERRAAMGGWEEEVYCSLYEVARISARLGRPEEAVIAAHLKAFERRPTRAESMSYLAAYLREHGRPAAAYPFAKAAADTPRPDDILFLDESVYAWRANDELAVAAYWTGRHREAIAANERLLAGRALPQGERARVQKNMDFSKEKLPKKRGK